MDRRKMTSTERRWVDRKMFQIRSRTQRGVDYTSTKELVVVMRVKNEEKRLWESIESTRRLNCPVIVLDDGSTDRTPEICYSFPWVEYHRQDEPNMNELRDRNKLLQMAVAQNPRWIFTLDGDEVLSERAPEEIIRAVKNAGKDTSVLRMAIAFMWHDEYMVDFPLGPFWNMRAFRVSDRNPGGIIGTFRPVGMKPLPSGLHCGCIPQMNTQFSAGNIQAWIKAYGYNNQEEYEKKLAFYNRFDPTMWSQIEIVERLNNPLVKWDENLIPRVKNPEESQEYLTAKMYRRIKVWEGWTSEQIDSQKPKADEVGLGHKRIEKTRAASNSGKARRGRPRVQRDDSGTTAAGS